MIVLRSTLFMVWAIVLTVAFAPFVIALALIAPGKAAYHLIRPWRRLFIAAVRLILGIRTEVRGLENLPKEPCILLAKHQSAWETVALQDFVPEGSFGLFVLKRELLKIPFFGWCLGAMRMISIDRKAGKDALDQVAEQGKARLAEGFSVIIFPEGTRVAPGEVRRFKPGGAYLAVRAGCPVVPVAHNAGELWPRQAFLKKPGVITLSIGPAIDPKGMTEQALNRQAAAWINAEMQRISPHRYPQPAPDAGHAAQD